MSILIPETSFSTAEIIVFLPKVELLMEFLEYISGQGGFLILALFVIVIVIYNKIKQRRDIRAVTKKKKRQ